MSGGALSNLDKTELTLAWKLVDFMPAGDEFSAQERKGFVNSRRAKLTNMQMRNLRTKFFALKDKYALEIKEAFFPETVHTGYFRVAGGNYSFMFILGHIFKDVTEANRMQSVHLKLYELRGDDDLLNEFDVAFSSKYKDAHKHDKGINKFKTLEERGFSYSKQFYKDEVRFATTQLVLSSKSKQEVLDTHPLIGLKLYRSEGSDRKEISVAIQIKPEGRTDSPKLVSDSYLFNYDLMKASYGLWVLFKSQLKEDELITISDTTTYIERHFLYRSRKPIPAMKAAKTATFKYLANIDKMNGTDWFEGKEEDEENITI